ncbi:MAG: hypothetical protein ABI607_07945 [Betaproteobacteria bacterium]
MSVATSEQRPVIAVTGLAFEARIAAGPGVRTIAGGGDRQRLSSALEIEFARGATGLLSFGVAGGLVSGAAPGTWIVADTVVTSSGRWQADIAWTDSLARRLPDALRGAVAGSDDILAFAAEKHALHATSGACAMDMESHVVAAFAAAHGVPFAVFRVIADPVGGGLAPAATKGMRPDGTIDQWAVLGALVRAPAQLPLLMRNALDARAAQRELSRGRRLLGRGLGYPDFG